jgi:hypothetical protein
MLALITMMSFLNVRLSNFILFFIVNECFVILIILLQINWFFRLISTRYINKESLSRKEIENKIRSMR